MMLKIAAAAALALAALSVQAADVQPLPGETRGAYQCRSIFVPQARQCVDRCDAAPSGDARWECVHACTTKSLWDMAQCREQGAPIAATTVASR